MGRKSSTLQHLFLKTYSKTSKLRTVKWSSFLLRSWTLVLSKRPCRCVCVCVIKWKNQIYIYRSKTVEKKHYWLTLAKGNLNMARRGNSNNNNNNSHIVITITITITITIIIIIIIIVIISQIWALWPFEPPKKNTCVETAQPNRKKKDLVIFVNGQGLAKIPIGSMWLVYLPTLITPKKKA